MRISIKKDALRGVFFDANPYFNSTRLGSARKFKVSSSRLGSSWRSWTPAAFSIRLDIRVPGVLAYLSER